MTLDPFRRRYKFTEVEDQGEAVREGEREKEKEKYISYWELYSRQAFMAV